MPFATADLCDEFGRRSASPSRCFRDWGGCRRFAGPIETVRVLRGQRAGAAGAGDRRGAAGCWWWTAAARCRSALVGGNLAALAQRNGWSGIVVHGCIRDTAELAASADRDQGARRRAPEERQGGAGERGVPVTLRRGHVHAAAASLYADRDGIVVADRDLLGAVSARR